MSGRYHDRAKLNLKTGRSEISIFEATSRILPYQLDLMERHTLGSQLKEFYKYTQNRRCHMVCLNDVNYNLSDEVIAFLNGILFSEKMAHLLVKQ